MDALIGYTGFVGSNIQGQRPFDALYNSRNIHEIEGRSFDLLVCAGAPGTKWLANQRPLEDCAAVLSLAKHACMARARRFVLISTVDVYPEPRGVDEASIPDVRRGHSYGGNRFWLEGVMLYAFDTMIVRLPALFGPGLKKNALYDLMYDHRTEMIPENAVYQWYPLRRLMFDVGRAEEAGLRIANFVSDPICIKDVRDRFFPGRALGPPSPGAPVYDVATMHPAFRLTREQVMDEMARFLEA